MKQIFRILFLFFLVVSCIDGQGEYYAYDIKLWKNTEAWYLAQCVSTNKFDEADDYIKEIRLDIDYMEPKFGETLLSWAVWNDNIDAVKFLVDHGADPNAHNTYDGSSPIVVASSGFSNISILDYLLKHGGNPNDYVKETEVLTYSRSLSTPLTKAAFISLNKTILLIESGGDVNFAVEPGHTPLRQAALGTRLDVLYYILQNCNLDYKSTFLVTIDTGDTLFLKDIIKTNIVAYRQDSVKAKQIIDYIEKKYEGNNKIEDTNL